MMGQRYTLFFAAKEGRLSDLLWVLNQKDASPNMRDGENQLTALHLTCSRGHTKCVEVLLKAGARVNCRTAEGMTPLHYATYGGHVDCVRLLLSAKADVHASTRFGCTALHQAVFFNRRNCAEILISSGGGVNTQESWGLTPLSIAAQKGDRYVFNNGHGMVKSEMMKLLLSSKALTCLQGKLDGKAPLHISIENNHEYCATLLLDGGANPSIPDTKGRTALHYACCCKCADTLVPVLLEYGANPCIKDNDGERPADKLAKSKEKQIDESSKKKLYEKLEQFSGKPRSLLKQCRVRIRRTLGPLCIDLIDDFLLPDSLRRYLKLTNV